MREAERGAASGQRGSTKITHEWLPGLPDSPERGHWSGEAELVGTALIGQEEPYPRCLKMGRGTSCWASWEGRQRRDLGRGRGRGGVGQRGAQEGKAG